MEGVKLEGILESGYGVMPQMITRDKSLSIEAKAIYAYLTAFAGNKKEAFPSVKLICSELKISEKRYLKHRKFLLDKGYIRIRRERTDNGFSKNFYELVQIIDSTVHSQNVSVQNVGVQNVSVQNVGVQNVGTNNNSINNNSINNNNDNNNNKDLLSCKQDYARQVIEYLNLKANKKFSHTTSKTAGFLNARYDDGYTLDQIKQVIDKKVHDWSNKKEMSNYLRPQTLFNPTNFEAYLNEGTVEDEKTRNRNGAAVSPYAREGKYAGIERYNSRV